MLRCSPLVVKYVTMHAIDHTICIGGCYWSIRVELVISVTLLATRDSSGDISSSLLDQCSFSLRSAQPLVNSSPSRWLMVSSSIVPGNLGSSLSSQNLWTTQEVTLSAVCARRKSMQLTRKHPWPVAGLCLEADLATARIRSYQLVMMYYWHRDCLTRRCKELQTFGLITFTMLTFTIYNIYSETGIARCRIDSPN